MIKLSFNTVVASFNRHWLEIIAVCYADHYHYLSFLDRWRSDYVTCFVFTGSEVELWQVFLGHVPYESTTVNSQTQILKMLCEVISGPCRKLNVKYIPFETGKLTSVTNTAVQCWTAMMCSTHTHHGQICCHNTDYVHIKGHDRTITVILAKHCIKLPDDGYLVIRNMLEQF